MPLLPGLPPFGRSGRRGEGEVGQGARRARLLSPTAFRSSRPHASLSLILSLHGRQWRERESSLEAFSSGVPLLPGLPPFGRSGRRGEGEVGQGARRARL